MDEQSSAQKIIEKIKEARIKPKPRWEFLLKNYLIWAIFAVAISVGSLAFGVIIFMFKNANWQSYAANEGIAKKLLISLPYFWFIILIIFIIIAFYNLKHTPKGYKYNPLLVVAASIIASIMIGSIVYATGGGEKLEDIFYRRMPFYQKIIKFHGQMMLAPEKGRVPGVVIEVTQDNILIQDFRGNIWNITTSTEQFVIGQRVIINGITPSKGDFRPHMIQPWMAPNHFMPKACPRCIRP
jgi:hypothetical protein